MTNDTLSFKMYFLIKENESAKGDLKFIDEWKHHLQEVPKTSFNLGLDDTTSSLIAEFLHGCDGMKKVPVSLPKIGYTSENNAQIHLKVCDEVMTENGNLFDDQVSRTTLDSGLYFAILIDLGYVILRIIW